VNILAFDTSGSNCTVALRHGKIVKSADIVAPMQQTKCLLPTIQELLSEANLDKNNLDVIVFGGGPGSFTGTRIASSVAQGLALALQKPLIRLSSLAILAQTAYLEKSWNKVAVAIDARMGQVYFGQYVCLGDEIMQCEGEEKLINLSAFPALTEGYVGIGDAWQLPAILQQNNASAKVCSTLLPTALALLSLAEFYYQHKKFIPLKDAIPVYLR
jgi:tRNA threonylcarbamoyladenosine biosynthesis protein TsaB